MGEELLQFLGSDVFKGTGPQDLNLLNNSSNPLDPLEAPKEEEDTIFGLKLDEFSLLAGNLAQAVGDGRTVGSNLGKVATDRVASKKLGAFNKALIEMLGK